MFELYARKWDHTVDRIASKASADVLWAYRIFYGSSMSSLLAWACKNFIQNITHLIDSSGSIEIICLVDPFAFARRYLDSVKQFFRTTWPG